MKTLFKVLLALPLFVASTHSAQALYVQKGDNITLDQKRYDETVLVAGNRLEIKSDINGDLICAGQTITITGRVTGDVLCAGQTINLQGDVDGNFRAVGQTINLTSRVGKNVSLASQNFNLGEKATIKNDLFYAGQDAQLLGYLGRDLVGGSETININNVVGRDAKLGFNRFNLGPTGRINGNLDYYIEKGSNDISATNIKGKLNRHEFERPQTDKVALRQKMDSYAKPMAAAGKFFVILSTFVIAAVAILLFKGSMTKGLTILFAKPISTFFIGFGSLFALPLIGLVLMLTGFGIPVAFLLSLGYIIGLMLALPYAGIAFGQLLHVKINETEASYFIYAAIGIPLMFISFLLPFVGCLLGIIAFCSGFGVFVRSFFSKD